MRQPFSFETLAEWLPWLEKLSPREIVLGLERVQSVLDRLQLRRPEIVIHVGGTNGKGSSVAMLESLLLYDGIETGCYTSPHLCRYNERIRIGGAAAEDDAIVSALRRVENARGDVPLTYFEYGTLAALAAFESANVNAWILEVGLGGRLDAVNAIEPDVSLITNVSLDHCAWLGNDIESIAREKAGIMRGNKPTIFGDPVVPAVIRFVARKIDADLLVAAEDFFVEKSSGAEGVRRWRGRRIEVSGLESLPLIGEVQMQNASAVLATIEALGMDHLLVAEKINAAFSKIELPGRFQVIERDLRWVLDVAHNPAAARALADRLGRLHKKGRVFAILGVLKDKDVSGVIAPLKHLVDRWLSVTVASSRAAPAGQLAQQVSAICEKPCLIGQNINEAFEYVRTNASLGDTVLVMGSFHVVGPALEWLDHTSNGNN